MSFFRCSENKQLSPECEWPLLDVTFFAGEQQSLVQNAEQPESDDKASITIVVSGDLPSEAALLNYFENARRSGGGEILNVECDDEGDVTITFAEVEGRGRIG